MKQACKEEILQLAMCVEKMPCVQEEKLTIAECLADKGRPLGDCKVYADAVYMCRRAQLDMRTRMRGKKYQDTG